MISSVIIDDDSRAIQSLEFILDDINLVSNKASVQSIDEAKKQITHHDPDIVFLDIELSGENGFELLQNMRSKKFEVICVSGHPSYALDAIKNKVFDFLVKPVIPEELEATIKKFNESVQSKAIPGTKILLNTINGLEFYQLIEIVRIESDGNYSNIFLNNSKKILSTKSLRYFEDVMPSNQFWRINRTDIINLNHIQQISRGRYPEVTLSNGDIKSVSDRKRKDFLNMIKENVIT